jgi:hypothetical protein
MANSINHIDPIFPHPAWEKATNVQDGASILFVLKENFAQFLLQNGNSSLSKKQRLIVASFCISATNRNFFTRRVIRLAQWWKSHFPSSAFDQIKRRGRFIIYHFIFSVFGSPSHKLKSVGGHRV